VYVEGDPLQAMADHFGLTVDDLPALKEKMPEWAGCESEIHDGRLCYWLRDNPNGKFEWYRIGGRFSGYLHLRQPRKPSLLGRFFGRKPQERVDRARKGEIVVEDVVRNPPFAFLVNGEWVREGVGDRRAGGRTMAATVRVSLRAAAGRDGADGGRHS
jgi:hypothetical protein